jgi:hypothetical protein
MKITDKHPASFRDPSGYIFVEDNIKYRRVNASYFKQFDMLHDSGLYNELAEKGLLISHETIRESADYKIICPEQLELITYPYEWCFSQLKDAALLTLRIHQTALKYRMVLKDATAFNIQFNKGRAVFIDTLSFDIYNAGDPWGAYGQFCRHFLAPLLLMKYISPDLNKLQMPFLDGVSLEVASGMLPLKTHFSPFIKANLHLHAKSYTKHQESFKTDIAPRLSLKTQNNIIENTASYINKLRLNSETEWGDYYNITNYKDKGFKFKENTVKGWVKKYDLKKIWDVGGNNGHFSRLIQEGCDQIICTDIDPVAVEKNYCAARKNNEQKITPLLLDYTNPSPGIGFSNKERDDFFSRIREMKVDCVMALALVHHLSISSNCTFEMLGESFSRISKKLIIEFVDPEDSWAGKLLDSKRSSKNLFSFYNKKNFESVFNQYYEFAEIEKIPDSKRTLYMMIRREN